MKYYIGKHQTNNLDDGYMGSGKYIKRAIVKHGLNNFRKDILFIFETEAEMNAKEAELVIVSEGTYNLCDGGKGGFSYINRHGLAHTEKQANAARKNGAIKTEKTRRAASEQLKRLHVEGKVRHDTFSGKSHSIETKQKMSKAAKKRPNPQIGTMWITDGFENKKIKRDVEDIPKGWRNGRVMGR